MNAPNTRCEIISRTVSTGGKIISRGQLVGRASGIKAHLECKGLILNDKGIQIAGGNPGEEVNPARSGTRLGELLDKHRLGLDIGMLHGCATILTMDHNLRLAQTLFDVAPYDLFVDAQIALVADHRRLSLESPFG